MKERSTIFDGPQRLVESQGIQQLLRMGRACHGYGELARAEVLYREVVRQAPDHFEAWHLLGLLAHQGEDMARALQFFDRALSFRPDFVAALNDRGVVLEAMSRDEEALASYQAALQLNALHIDALNNQGVVLARLGRLEEALQSYDQALSIAPSLADVLNNRATVLQDLERYDDALSGYAEAIKNDPAHADAHWNEARCRLLLGQYEEGWPKYEWRWRRPRFTSRHRNFSQPLWLGGEPLAGRVILLHAEQGLGDTLQFLRYVPMVAQLGAKVVLEVQAPLKPLLDGYPGVEILVGCGEELPAFDLHCPLLSLPLAYKTTVETIPSSGPYLKVDVRKTLLWQERLGAKQSVRVGLVWSGNPAQQDNQLRSVPLSELMKLSACGVQLFSLQKELRSAEERRLVEEGHLLHYGDDLHDFADTAALLGEMDLVISVCTSVAHLAGAMGKPLWVLLQRGHDWRWLLGRNESPWYGSARLYRQTNRGDWRDVMERVVRDMHAWRDKQ